MSLDVLFHFTTEESFLSAEKKLDDLCAIVSDIAPHLIEAQLDASIQASDILAAGGTAYTRETPIPLLVLESMPLDVRAYAQAFMAQPLRPSDTEGYSWNVFDVP